MADKELSDVSITNLTGLQSGDELYVIRGGVPHRVDFDALSQKGTTSPEVYGVTSPGTATYSTNALTYSRIGDLLHIEIHLVWSGHTGTGNMRIDTKLPFTFNGYARGGIHAVGLTTTGNNPYGQSANGSNFIEVYEYSAGSIAVAMDAAATIRLSLVVKVN